MPPIGLLLGKVDFSNLFLVIREEEASGAYDTLAAAKAAGAVTINYGLFINTIISFLIVAFAVFMLIRAVNKLKREASPREANTRHLLVLSIPLFRLKHPAVRIASLRLKGA